MTTETTKAGMISYLNNLMSSPNFLEMFGTQGVKYLDEIKQYLIKTEEQHFSEKRK